MDLDPEFEGDEVLEVCGLCDELRPDLLPCRVCATSLCPGCRACRDDCGSGLAVCHECAERCLSCNARTCGLVYCTRCGQGYACCGCARDAECECETEGLEPEQQD